MAETPIPITSVRWDGEQGRQRLKAFIFGGMYAGRRAPRGVNPELVSEFIREELKPDSPDHAYMRTADLLRFYERADVLDHIRLALTGAEAKIDDVSRSCYALQMYGDLGTTEQVGQAAAYFDRILAPHPEAGQLFALMLETIATLVPGARIDKLQQRMAADMQAASQVPNLAGPKGARYRTLSDLLRTNLPRALAVMQAKARLLGTPLAQRRSELIYIYSGESDLSDAAMEVWAARWLRREAIEVDRYPVYADLARVIDAADPKRLGPERADFLAHRAAQAILYLQGKLTSAQRIRYESIRNGPVNFLWDDPEGPPEAE